MSCIFKHRLCHKIRMLLTSNIMIGYFLQLKTLGKKNFKHSSKHSINHCYKNHLVNWVKSKNVFVHSLLSEQKTVKRGRRLSLLLCWIPGLDWPPFNSLCVLQNPNQATQSSCSLTNWSAEFNERQKVTLIQ